MGAVGVDYFVEMVNGRYSVWRKSDNVNVGSTTMTSFFNGALANTGGASISTSVDPRVVYDHASGRWLATGQAGQGLLFAVSLSSDPSLQNGSVTWNGFRPANAEACDQPGLGVNADGVFIATRVFGISGGEEEEGNMFGIDDEKAQLISMRKAPGTSPASPPRPPKARRATTACSVP
jgi:hypothetical protein